MNYSKVLLVVSALVILISTASRASESATPAQPGTGDSTTPPAAPAPPPTGDPSNPATTPGAQIAAQVKQAIDAAQAARNDFLKAQQDLHTQMASATTQAAREKIREDLQKARETFLAAQRQARQDLKASIAKIKDQLKDHQDAINSAV